MLDANRSHIFDGVIGMKDIAAKFNTLELDRQRAIVDVLYEITIHLGQPSRRPFTRTVMLVPKG